MAVISIDQLIRAIEKAADNQTVKDTLSEALNESHSVVISEVKRCIVEKHGPNGEAWSEPTFPRPTGEIPDTPLIDTKQLMDSTDARSDDESITVSVRRKGCRLMHFGGTVRAKNVEFMTIPLTVEARKATSARNFPRPLRKVMTSSDAGLLVEKTKDGKFTQAQIHYLLKKEVYIPPRPYLGFTKEAKISIVSMIKDKYRKAIIAATRG